MESCAACKNSELRPEGYFWAVHVEPGAVGTPIDVQLYDPAFVFTQQGLLGNRLHRRLRNNINDYTTTDAQLRYRSTIERSGGRPLLLGRLLPWAASGTALTTTFTMREQTDTNDPMKAP